MPHVERRDGDPHGGAGDSTLCALSAAAQRDAIQRRRALLTHSRRSAFRRAAANVLHEPCQLLGEISVTFAAARDRAGARHALRHSGFRRDGTGLFEPVGHRPTRPCTSALDAAREARDTANSAARRDAFDEPSGHRCRGAQRAHPSAARTTLRAGLDQPSAARAFHAPHRGIDESASSRVDRRHGELEPRACGRAMRSRLLRPSCFDGC